MIDSCIRGFNDHGERRFGCTLAQLLFDKSPFGCQVINNIFTWFLLFVIRRICLTYGVQCNSSNHKWGIGAATLQTEIALSDGKKHFFNSKFKRAGVWWVLKSYFHKKLLFPRIQDHQKVKRSFAVKGGPLAGGCLLSPSSPLRFYFNFNFQKLLIQLSNYILVFIKNSTLPFEIPSAHYVRTDNIIFNKTKTLLKSDINIIRNR